MKRAFAFCLALCLTAWGISCAFAEEKVIRGDYEFTVDKDGYETATAYLGEYLPRTLPREVGWDPLPLFGELFGHLMRENGLFYYGPVAEDEMYIFGYTGYAPLVIIPEELDGVPVTGVGDYAFQYSGVEREPFAEAVVIPGTVRSIGRMAFSCTSVAYILLEEGLEEIGDLAFEGHSQITMKIPASVRRMGVNPFADHVDLGWVNGYLFPFPASEEYFRVLSDIGGRLLYSVQEMKTVCYRENVGGQFSPAERFEVEEGIRVIGEMTFHEAWHLKEILLPDGLEVIEARAFDICPLLETVRIPDGVREIGSCAFCDTAVRRLDIPDSVTVFGERIVSGYKDEDVVIVCSPGSAAEEYAAANGYRVEHR